MCKDCGCGQKDSKYGKFIHEHEHRHGDLVHSHPHEHEHEHDPVTGEIIEHHHEHKNTK
ncbi:MAG: hypothetical protein Q9M37_06275 [Desulfonauticus sp.]|nr:hypothetical protein [Desulfonauticus sp.]